jgi:hypothetical protein
VTENSVNLHQIEKEKKDSLQQEIEKIKQEANLWLQKEISKNPRESESKERSLIQQFENEQRKQLNQLQTLSNSKDSLQNENNQITQKLEENRSIFEARKSEFLHQMENKKRNSKILKFYPLINLKVIIIMLMIIKKKALS